MHEPVDTTGRVVSVVIPAFNTATYLSETVSAALASELVGEVIIVDDGSTDHTAALLQSLRVANPRLKVITQANQGVSTARNTGFRAVAMPFTCFVDADDILLPGGLAELHRLLVTNPAAAAAYGGVDYIDERSQPLKLSFKRGKDQVIGLEQVLQASFIDTLGAMLCRTDAIVACGAFNQALHYAEDWEFLTRLVLSGPFLPLNRSVLAYRQHSQSAMQGKWLDMNTMEPAIELVFSPSGLAAARIDKVTLKRLEQRRRAGNLRRLGHRGQSASAHFRILGALLRIMAASGCDRAIVELFARAVLTSGKRIILRP